MIQKIEGPIAGQAQVVIERQLLSRVRLFQPHTHTSCAEPVAHLRQSRRRGRCRAGKTKHIAVVAHRLADPEPAADPLAQRQIERIAAPGFCSDLRRRGTEATAGFELQRIRLITLKNGAGTPRFAEQGRSAQDRQIAGQSRHARPQQQQDTPHTNAKFAQIEIQKQEEDAS